jgi:hypothetical protein
MASASQGEDDLPEFASETFCATTTVGVSDGDGTTLALDDAADGDGVAGLGLAEFACPVGETGACAGVLCVTTGAGCAGLGECAGCFHPWAYSLNAFVTKRACS